MAFKIIVAHPAQQHSYKTAAALKKNNHLFKYITTVYNKDKSLTRLILKFLKGNILERASNRRTDNLSDTDVKQFCEFESLILLILQRVDKKKHFYNRLNKYIVKKFNKKLVKFSIKNNIDILILYDKYASSAFEELNKKKSSTIKVLDCSAPNFSYMNDIFYNYIVSKNINNKKYVDEFLSNKFNEIKNDSIKELEFSDNFLSASTFTTKSLLASNINKNKIYLCSYGVDVQKINKSTRTLGSDNELKCLFVGRVTYKKGVLELFKAIEKLNTNKFHFTFVGSYDLEDEYIYRYKNICDFKGHVPKKEMSEIYSNADILIFPSLADGFGLSVIEALSYGLPVVCSTNSGASDIIKDGVNGFLIDPLNYNDITDKLSWLENNRSFLNNFSKNAILSAKENSVNKYEKSILSMVDSILK
jgi:glycosyltransferase involved in cell wall biosynthesis